jgi:3-hydroxyisobutyrate dehydrogenase-like beta-hydroxyacid dehydrogenase
VTGVERAAVLGLGEAGALIAADLATTGLEVGGYDPADVPTPAGVKRHDDPADAVAGVDLVLAVTSAAHALAALGDTRGAIPPGAIYADLSTAAPAIQRELAGIAGAAGVKFVDVALMAPVPGTGLRTPALASGPAAAAFVAALSPLGMPVEHAGDEAGLATTRKLLRSIVMKGLAALLVESLQAAEAAGLAAETWDNVVRQLAEADEALVRRLVTGTPRHAKRRIEEMDATAALLADLDVDPTMTEATAERLRRIAADPSLVPEVPAARAPAGGAGDRGSAGAFRRRSIRLRRSRDRQ